MHLGEKFKIKPLSLLKWFFKKKISRKWENGQNRKWKGLSGQAGGSRWWPAAKMHKRVSASVRPSLSPARLNYEGTCLLPPLPPLPPGTVPTTFKVGDRDWWMREGPERRDRGTQGPPLLRLLRVASPLWLPNEQEMDASASCPGTEFTMHPMSLTATCSTAIKAVREKLIFNQ